MWAPGAYIASGRVTLPAPNIGVEKYFFEVADTILSHIRSSRNTAILPQRVGPIADVLYSAAGNSADENFYKRGIIAYSFEAGAQRIAVNPTTGAISRTNVGFQPCFAGPGTQGGQGSACGTVAAPNALLVNEGHDSTMEFAEGNFGMIQGALEYHNDTTAPETTIEYSAAQTGQEPIDFRFNWVNEPSVIYYTTDGSTPVKVDCNAAPGVSRCYQNQGPRRPGEVLRISALGVHDVKWFSEDIKGNRSAVKTQRLLIAADQETSTPGGTVPATLSLSLGTAATFGAFTPGVPRDYNASTTANVISTAGDARLSVVRPELDGHRTAGQRHVLAAAGPAGQRVEHGRHGRSARSGRRLGQPDHAADVHRTEEQRLGDGELQADDRRQRRAPHGRLRQDPDVHPVDDDPVGRPDRTSGRGANSTPGRGRSTHVSFILALRGSAARSGSERFLHMEGCMIGRNGR